MTELSKQEVRTRLITPAIQQDQYAAQGIAPLEDAADPALARQLLSFAPYRDLGTPMEIARAYGGPQPCLAAVRELEQEIHRAA